MSEIRKTENIAGMSVAGRNTEFSVVAKATGISDSDRSAVKTYYTEGLDFEVRTDDYGRPYAVVTGLGEVTAKSFTIPNTLDDGTPVKVIGDSAFGEENITEVTIPASVTRIESFAFYDSEIETILFESGSKLEYIGTSAFEYSKLTSIEIPASVELIDTSAFAYCPLSDLAFENGQYQTVYFYNDTNWDNIHCYCWDSKEGNNAAWPGRLMTKVTDRLWSISLPRPIVGIVFSDGSGSESRPQTPDILTHRKCMHNTIWTASGKENTNKDLLPITDTGFEFDTQYGTLTIGYGAFEATPITKLRVPMNCVKIDQRAFYNCSSMQFVTLFGMIKSIGNEAFSMCTSIDRDAFIADGSVLSMEYDKVFEAPAQSNITSIGVQAFYKCVSMKQVTIPGSVTWMGANAFGGIFLTSVKMCDSYGWFYTSELAITGGTYILSSDLYSTNIAASYLRDVYPQYNWYKLEKLLTPTLEVRTNNILIINDPSGIATNALIYVGSAEPVSIAFSVGQAIVDFDKLNLSPGIDNTVSVILEAYNIDPSDAATTKIYVTDLEYTEEEDYLVVSGPGTDMPASLHIPYWHEGHKKYIKKIANDAFKDNTKLVEISIDGKVEYIGNSAFYGCTKLTKVTFVDAPTIFVFFYNPQGWTNVSCYAESVDNAGINDPNKIGTSMISMGNNIYRAEIPANTTKIVFNNGIRSAGGDTLPTEKSPDITSGIFNGKCWRMHHEYAGPGLGVNGYIDYMTAYDYTDPDDTHYTTLSNYIFKECGNLTEVTISNRIKKISDGMFDHCAKLSTVNFNDRSCLTSIGYSAFNSTDLSVKCILPQGLEYINNFAFSYTNLGTDNNTFHVPLTVKQIGTGAFKDCEHLLSVNLVGGTGTVQLKLIGEEAFKDCTALVEINVPETVETIYNDAFAGCSALNNVYMLDYYGWRGTWTPEDEDTRVRMLTPNEVANSTTFARLLKDELSDYTFTNINKLWTPEIDLTGDILTIVDRSGFAESFDIYVNGTFNKNIPAK